MSMWSAHRDDDSIRSADDLGRIATPGLGPIAKPGLNPIELIVDGEAFVVTRRADSPGTFDFN